MGQGNGSSAPVHLSKSILGTWGRCRLAYKYERVDRIASVVPPSAAQLRGTAAHAAFSPNPERVEVPRNVKETSSSAPYALPMAEHDLYRRNPARDVEAFAISVLWFWISDNGTVEDTSSGHGPEQASRYATFKKPPATPTHGPPCATTAPASPSTDTPPTSSQPSSQERPDNPTPNRTGFA
jgi:hypothetical protein